jgi:hypothetical protein
VEWGTCLVFVVMNSCLFIDNVYIYDVFLLSIQI